MRTIFWTTILSGALFLAGTAWADGAVYVLGNEADGNAVLVYQRAPDGTLAAPERYPTGGLGSGAPLESQGAIALSRDHRLLFAVDAGSDEVSYFAVGPAGLRLIGRAPAGGVEPVSLAYQDGLLYVLDAGGQAEVTGFYVTRRGLEPIPGSTQPLSAAAPGPAQIGFSPDGSELVVTEKATNRIDTYGLDCDGAAGPPVVHASAGQTPYGFGFATVWDGARASSYLLVSEAFGGAPGASALSSYAAEEGSIALVSPSVPTGQTAACWVAVDGRYVYTTNAGSGSITGYRLEGGRPVPLDGDGRTGDTGAGSAPLDLAPAGHGRFLYVLESGTHAVGEFAVARDGSLAALGRAPGLPASASGLTAR